MWSPFSQHLGASKRNLEYIQEAGSNRWQEKRNIFHFSRVMLVVESRATPDNMHLWLGFYIILFQCQLTWKFNSCLSTQVFDLLIYISLMGLILFSFWQWFFPPKLRSYTYGSVLWPFQRVWLASLVAFLDASFKTVFISSISWLPVNSSQLNSPLKRICLTQGLCFLQGNSPYSTTGHCGGTKGCLPLLREICEGPPRLLSTPWRWLRSLLWLHPGSTLPLPSPYSLPGVVPDSRHFLLVDLYLWESISQRIWTKTLDVRIDLRRQILKWDLGAGSLIGWLSVRTPGLSYVESW